MEVIANNMLELVPENNRDYDVLESAKRELTLRNPQYDKMLRLGKRPWKIQEHLRFYEGNKFPRGYLFRLVSYFPEKSFHFKDFRRVCEKQYFSFHGKLRPYQEKAVTTLGKTQDGVLVAPCGSGKTAMAMALIARKKQPALILVHTKELLYQMAENIRYWLGEEPGIIGGGKRDVKRVTVSTLQSLRKEESTLDIKDVFGLILVDECHHVPAMTFSDVVSRFPAKYRYGLTATPERQDGLSEIILYALGPIRYRVTMHDLEKHGLLSKPKLFWIPTDFAYEYRDDFPALISALTEDAGRNEILVDLATRAACKGRSVLLLSSRVDHCQILFRMIEKKNPGISVAITGSMKQKNRKNALDSIKQGQKSILVASSIADEGLNVPVLDTLIFATPFKAKGKVFQRVGRILRRCDGKNTPVVCDLDDWRVSILQYQAWSRYEDGYRALMDKPKPPREKMVSKYFQQEGGFF